MSFTSIATHRVTLTGTSFMHDDTRDFLIKMEEVIKSLGSTNPARQPNRIIVDASGITDSDSRFTGALVEVQSFAKTHNAKLAIVVTKGTDLDQKLRAATSVLRDVTVTSLQEAEQNLAAGVAAGRG